MRHNRCGAILILAFFTTSSAVQYSSVQSNHVVRAAGTQLHRHGATNEGRNPFSRIFNVFDWGSTEKKDATPSNSGPFLKSNDNTTSDFTNELKFSVNDTHADDQWTANNSQAELATRMSRDPKSADGTEVKVVTDSGDSAPDVASGVSEHNSTDKQSGNPLSRFLKAINPHKSRRWRGNSAGQMKASHVKADDPVKDIAATRRKRKEATFRMKRRSQSVRKKQNSKRLTEVIAWKRDFVVKKDVQTTSRSCQVGAQYCKSLCRWMKLTDKDFNVGESRLGANESICPLLDWSMEGCGYIPIDERIHEQAEESIDCAVHVMHRNVFRDDVAAYVQQLEVCMLGLPEETTTKYSVPLKMLADEISDWKAEQGVRVLAAKVEERLRGAIMQGRQAYQTQDHEVEAASNLTAAMREAGNVSGHYLVDDVRTGRELLDKLEPIIVVRGELQEATILGSKALRNSDPKAVRNAVVWLNVSLAGAERLKLERQVPAAKEIRDHLLIFQSISAELKAVMFQANVSLTTNMRVPFVIDALNASMQRAKEVNATNKLPMAKDMIHRLSKVKTAGQALQDALRRVKTQLASESNSEEGVDDFTEAINLLNSTMRKATLLGLDNQASEAVVTLRQLEETRHAREALHSAILKGKAVVLNETGKISDNDEEMAMSLLAAAVPWAERLGLKHGIPIAKALLERLKVVEEAKEHMALSLVRANASLVAKAGENEAIRSLMASVKEEKALNLTAGVVKAKAELKKLRAMKSAREDLEAAVESANSTLITRRVKKGEIVALNMSIHRALAEGLSEESAVATAQLGKLVALKEAQQDLEGAMTSAAHKRIIPNITHIDDPNFKGDISAFQGRGLRIVDLPDVPGAADDGDYDFEEHIKKLNASIAQAQNLGLMDPDMIWQLKELQTLQKTWDALHRAMTSGDAAINSRSGLYTASVQVKAAIEEAEDMGLHAGVPKAKVLLGQLQEIPELWEDLETSMLQANISLNMKSGMHESLIRINAVIDHAHKLHVGGKLRNAEQMRDKLAAVNEALLHLRASTVQGTVALRLEHGEEAAITELSESVQEAKAVDLHLEIPTAVELLSELMHMNAEHQQIEAAVVPDLA